MSVESNEIEKILAEGFDADLDLDSSEETVNQILENKPPYLFISLDNEFYVAGDRLQGEIMLEVPNGLGPASVQISAQGIEEVHVFHQSQHISQSTNKVFSLNSQLKNWESLGKGHFLLPFSFKIPVHSPPTFYYSGQDPSGKFIKAQVSYTISGKLLYKNEEISYSRAFVIRDKESRSSPHVSTESTELVAGICCSNKGSSTFKLEVTSENHPIANTFINYKLTPDNGNCAAPINQVIAEIVMEIEVTSGEKTYIIRNTVSSVPRITWIAAFTSMIFEKDFEFTGELKSGGDELNAASIDTNFIKCRYLVEVKVHYDLQFRKEPACVWLKFFVNPNESNTKDVPKLPLGWSPLSEPVVSLMPDN